MAGTGIVVISAARTASGNSGAIKADIGARNLSVLVDVTAASGTVPTLDTTIEWSFDGTNFAVVDGTQDLLAQVTAAAKKVKTFTVRAQWYRIVWTITGTTPSFTFAVSALEN